MKRTYYTFHVEDIVKTKQQMLSWVNQFNICCFLDNHNYSSSFHSFDCVAGVGVIDVFKPGDDFFSSLSNFVTLKDDWLFGHFNYDLKNKIEDTLSSSHIDHTDFPDFFLFVPEVVVQLTDSTLKIGVVNTDAQLIYKQISEAAVVTYAQDPVILQPRISREDYLATIVLLQQHIKQGDCYEINFCQEFYGWADIWAVAAYLQLSSISPNPFSAFYKLSDKYLACASPERYIKKEGRKIISQPIKGTAARSENLETDDNLKKQLLASAKDRSENVMIVDLVRNDLSKVCGEGTVKVEELFGIYTFPHVHQMISTITGTLDKQVEFGDILKATFPMGSMTGAPKKKVMELIEQYETSKRGIYSGTVGYISPDKDFDFNVVIRSLVYNRSTGYLSFHAGSAITSYSDPVKEYEECMLKGKAIMEVLSAGKGR